MKRFHWNHLKLRDKLLWMYLLSVLLPIVLTNIFFYNVTTTNIKNQKTRDAQVALDRLQGEVRSVIDEAAGISYLYYADLTLHDLIDRSYDSKMDYIEAYTTYTKTGSMHAFQAYKSIKQGSAYTDNPTILPSGIVERIHPELEQSEGFKRVMANSSSFPVLTGNGGGLSLFQRLNNYPAAHGYRKLLKIDLNIDSIREVFDHSTFEGFLYLIDDKGIIVYSNDTRMDWRRGDKTDRLIPMGNSNIRFDKSYSNIHYLNGWKLLGIMDEKHILEEVRKSRAFVVVLACLNFVIPSLIIAAISRSIHVRLVRLLKHMKLVKNQSFETISPDGSRDEIGQLSTEFNRMTLRIGSLIDDVLMADIQKKDLELKQQQAQLHALQSQINPHFLFNALETIRMRSILKNESETATIIRHMAQIFRKSISWGRDWVTVREELELIECFLEIQKYRFGDKLEYHIDVDPDIREELIPKMTLLPFVENASIHGIEQSPGKGVIDIHIGFSEGGLVFELTDNGIGMNEEKLAAIRSYLNDDESMGDKVGMKNAYYRLKMYYGDGLRFSIHSKKNVGTDILIRLPLNIK
jgi:two-component system, sensor histidine kinase YesM